MAAGALCHLCPLRGSVVVPPYGPADAKVVVVAEGPASNEVRRGVPLIGPSGMLLDEILMEASKLTGIQILRKDVWTTNSICCRPQVPGEQGPKSYEVKRYLAWLRKENYQRRKAGAPETMDPFTACKPRLDAEIAYFRDVAARRGDPEGLVVVPIGNFALKAILGKEGIMKHRGSTYRVRERPEPVVT